VRAVLLRGAGGNFMNGVDLTGLYGKGGVDLGIERANQMMQPYHNVIRELQVMDKPVIAAVEGAVAGPGLSLMLACDLVLAARGTKFNCNFTSNALSPDGGSTFFLARKVGAAKAMELLMLSEDFTAEDAQKWNLVNHVSDDGKLQDDSLGWVDRLANGPTRAFSGVKKLVLKAFENDLNAQLALEHSYWGGSVRSFDFREAMKAHFAKREAKYSGA
jgi:2-(1,2-epoxy-1,2-dihydrophenyl)acetyl-CoA isomerase